MHIPNTHLSDRLFLGLALLAALFALVMHVGIARTNVSRTEWAAPARHVLQHFRKGDAIGILPHWALKGAEPFRNHPLLYHENFAATDLSRYRRLWLVVAPRLGKWWFRRAFSSQLSALRKLYWMKEKRRFGKLELYLFQLPPRRPPLYNFASLASLKSAEVWLDTPQPNVAGCPSTGKIERFRTWTRQPGWWRGPRGAFFGRMVQEVGDVPRGCIWAQPVRCKVLHARYRLVPLQGTLQIAHGIGTAAPAKVVGTLPPSGPDVKLSVWIENQRVREFVVTQRQGWRTHQIDLSRLKLQLPPRPPSLASKPPTGSVEFRVEVPGRKSGRLGHCFQATLLPQE